MTNKQFIWLMLKYVEQKLIENQAIHAEIMLLLCMLILKRLNCFNSFNNQIVCLIRKVGAYYA